MSRFQIEERGKDFAVFRKVTETQDSDGRTLRKTNEFTLLENGLHYLDRGEWLTSEDIVESFPGGAVARRSPNKALFSPELNVENVFDLETATGNRIRGGVRAIELVNAGTGERLTLGTVRESAKAQLLPPNQILWEDGFDGITADVLLVWKYGVFQHNVLLRQQPELPLGWDAEDVWLRVLTEFLVNEEPNIQSAAVDKRPGGFDDHRVISFGGMDIVMGNVLVQRDLESGRLGLRYKSRV